MPKAISTTQYFVAASILCIALSGCQSTDSGSGSLVSGAGIDKPGTYTKLTNFDRDKWTASTANNVMRLVCRPLACPEPSILIIARGRAPTRDPDPAALQKFARETVPTNIAADNLKTETASRGHVRLQMINTVVAPVRGFPAVTVDFKRTGVGAPDFGARTYLFAGNTLISVMSVSKSKAIAHKNLDEYIAAQDIIDLPPPEQSKIGLSSPPRASDQK